MRKLKLEAEDLVVETFDTVAARDGDNGTVHGFATEPVDGCTIDVACTRVGSCPVEACWGQETNDPRQRLCVTPWVECSTQGWTCDYC
jgi:hypothetical protein